MGGLISLSWVPGRCVQLRVAGVRGDPRRGALRGGAGAVPLHGHGGLVPVHQHADPVRCDHKEKSCPPPQGGTVPLQVQDESDTCSQRVMSGKQSPRCRRLFSFCLPPPLILPGAWGDRIPPPLFTGHRSMGQSIFCCLSVAKKKPL